MRVILAGATGAVGTELTRQLMSAGHEVIGLTRTHAGGERLRRAGAGAVVCDVLDRAELISEFRGTRADAVVHQATAIAKMPTAHRDLHETNRLRTEGTEHLVELARHVGATRFVTQSFLFGYGYGDHGTRPVDEDTPFAPPGRGGFEAHLAAMRRNEELVLGSRDIAGVSLRYGMFYGDEPNTLRLFAQAGRGRLAAPRRGGLVSFVHLEDAASAAVAALEQGRPGEAYNIADDAPLTWTGYMRAIATAAGGRAPFLFPNTLLRFSPYLGTLMTRTNLALDTSKAARELGWRPRFATAEQGLADVARLRQERAVQDRAHSR